MAAEAGLNEIYRALGGLTAEVQGLRAVITESDRRSSEHRSRVYGKLEEIDQRTGTLEHRVDAASAAIADIKPTIDEVRRWKQRGIGALAIVGFAASAIGVALGLLWDKISAWISVG